MPAEVQLCDAVRLSEEEYWYFVDLAEQYNGKRDPAYDHIPDIRCDPVSIIVSLVVGVAMSAVSSLLAPKPKAPEENKRLANQTLGGAESSPNYAQTDGFQSVQDLAKVGQTIPLVFAKRGVRVNGQLVWSQMITESRSLQLKAMFVFSDGITEEPPDFAGLAIGDTTLKSYTAQKVRAHWNAFGGRITTNMALLGSGLPPQNFSDAYGTYWDGSAQIEPFFSGATFTSVQSQFGCYAPMHSETCYKPTPELILVPMDAKQELQDDLYNRRDLMNRAKFSQRAFFREVRNPLGGGGLGYSGPVTPSPTPGGTYDQIMYRISTGCEQFDPEEYKPEKLGFVNSATISARQAADQNISVGELYLVGNIALGVCAEKIYSDPARLWNPDPSQLEYATSAANEVTAWFTITDGGYVQCIPNRGGPAASEAAAVDNPQENFMTYALQRAAVATVTNTVPCQATELIIKSNVWKQVSGFPDIQAWPSEKLIDEYREYGGSLSLGPVSKYQRRLSFFALEARTVGEDTWTDITGTAYFMIEGNAPVDQYNYIRVDVGPKHPGKNVESEFRLRPVSGVGALRMGWDNPNNPMRRLRYGTERSYKWNGYYISYSGEEVALTEEFLANPDFVRAADTISKDGAIDNLGIRPMQAGIITGEPAPARWVDAGWRYNLNGSRNFLLKRISFKSLSDNLWQYWWDNSNRAQGTTSSQNIEPPQATAQMYPSNGRIVYYWSLATPGRENDIWRTSQYLTVYRSIRREDFISDGSRINGQPYTAGVVDAIPETPTSVAEGASGLKFFVEVWKNSLGADVGYKWTVDATNQGSGYQPGDRVIVHSPTTGRPVMGVTITGTTTAETVTRDSRTYSFFDPILDIPQFDSQNQSNTSEPEHELVAINEKRAQAAPTYADMTTGGIRINSSTEWSNFSSFSAYMKKGIVLTNLATNAYEASNLLPDIVYGLMTNEVWGAGKILGKQQVNVDEMIIASKFCSAMGFTWDGVIGQKINFREWAFRNAQYCLLDATVIGGRFALTPAVPYTSDYKVGNFVKPKILALFTDGNMKDMEVTWLGPDERQLFIADVVWREETANGFPKKRQFTMRMSDAQGGSDADPVETFDMSEFCTSQAHAFQFAQFALMVRKHVDHAIKFLTTPQAAMGLIPGQYFKVNSVASHTSRFNNGSINGEGYVTSNEQLNNGSHPIYFWRPGTEGISETTIQVTDGRCSDSGLFSCVFTLKGTTTESRVYKLESLSYAEDGLVEVAGSHMPLTQTECLKILDWNPAYFETFGVA